MFRWYNNRALRPRRGCSREDWLRSIEQWQLEENLVGIRERLERNLDGRMKRLIRMRRDRIIGDICKILITLDIYRMVRILRFLFWYGKKKKTGLIFIYSFAKYCEGGTFRNILSRTFIYFTVFLLIGKGKESLYKIFIISFKNCTGCPYIFENNYTYFISLKTIYK